MEGYYIIVFLCYLTAQRNSNNGIYTNEDVN